MAIESETQVMSVKFDQICGAFRKALMLLPVGALYTAPMAPPIWAESGFESRAVTELGTLPPAMRASDGPVSDGPAMWRMSDDDTEIFLFGTIHVLPEGVQWRRDEVMNVFSTADIVYFETTDRDPSSGTYLDFFKAGIAAPGQEIKDVLNAEQYAELSDALDGIGLRIQNFQGQQPWFAALMMSVMALEAEGHLAEYGVESWMETQLGPERDVRSLENGMEVAYSLARLPISSQIAMLMDGLDELKEIQEDSSDMDDSMNAWLSGDTEALYEEAIGDMKTDMPEVYEVMFTRRNRHWVNMLEWLMGREEGSIFVAVGSGHLTGPDSVIRLLEKKGWKLERL
jgi:uncharacterized protein YbaP (TraB family)